MVTKSLIQVAIAYIDLEINLNSEYENVNEVPNRSPILVHTTLNVA